MRHQKSYFIVFFIFLFTTGVAQVNLVNLKVEYQKKPLGLDVEMPRFSWIMKTDSQERGLSQKAYALEVLDDDGKPVWNSGKQNSNRSLNIPYLGKSLKPETRYTWNLKVWDNHDREITASSWFETGLMNASPDLEAWDGAQWIGGTTDDLPLYAQALSVFKASYKVRLDEESASHKAGFVFGANDERLLNKNLNIFEVENKRNESYIIFELDLTAIDDGKNASLNVVRRGYTQEEQEEKQIYSFPIPTNLINKSNQYDWHEVYFELNFGKCLIYINGRQPEHLINSKNEPDWIDVRGESLNPLGDAGGDLIVYPVLADIGFKVPKTQKAAFKNVQIFNYREPSNPLFREVFTENLGASIFDQSSDYLNKNDTSYVIDARKKEVLITADPSRNAMPMLRTEFALNKKIKKARLYTTARGIYEFYINGEKVNDNYFAPGLTQYNKLHMYQTYNITPFLKQGANAVGALLGEGWWSGSISYRGFNWNYFGDRQSILTKMVITFEDGSTQTLVSNPDKWKIFNDGPIRYSSFFQGEYYNQNKEEAINGWLEPNFNDQHWKNASIVPLDSTTAYIDENLNYEHQKIVAQIGKSPNIVKQITPISKNEVRPGVFIYDMGQNMVGFPKIELNAPSEDTIRLRYAEMLYPDLPQYSNKKGMLMLENIRGALTTDQWILANDNSETIIEPKFTFHGFRYLEITGLKEAPPLGNITGMVVSSIDTLSSHYETSNEKVNKLWENITWSFRSNFLSIPTDTPARNERMGWNGDINVFAETATFLGDVDLFLKRHLIANRNLQSEVGRFPDIAPIGTGFGGTLWGSAGVTIPWTLYQQYGDRKILEEHYAAMKKYVQFLASKENEAGVLTEGPLGDWLSPEGFKNDNTQLWTAYQLRNLAILSQTASILGKLEEANTFKDQLKQRREFFNNTYFNAAGKSVHTGMDSGSIAPKPENYQHPESGSLVDTQASYAIPLNFDLVSKNDEAAAFLAGSLTRENIDYTGVLRPEKALMTGFIGTSALLPALSKNGYNSLAYEVLQQTSYPSWLYSVENGATTIWERLNSYTKEEGFGGNNSMNSFNHYSFGAVGAWMYAYSLGIQPLEPGYKTILLKPIPDPTGKMTWASGFYDSVYGRIKSSWEKKEGKIIYKFSIPPNTKAKVELLHNSKSEIHFKNYTKTSIKELDENKNFKSYLLLSGSYQIEVLNN